jgi:BirA family biotin operon repressor/biotin-[acetyl-CoA-carboxylase] ligase
MTDILTSERIAALLRPAAQHVAVRIVQETGSTNADLLAELPTLHGPVLLQAKRQTAGRGRAGRSWHSAEGKSLTFSLAWKFGLPVHALVGLPLAVGVALAEAMAIFSIDASLKWPNDILYQGRKLAGILIESASAGPVPHDASWAVIGVGINIAIDERMAAEIGRAATGIPWLADLDQNMLMATLVSSLAEALVQFEHEGLSAFIGRWNALHAHEGQAVAILDNGRVLHEGIGRGIDASGRFLIDTTAGQVAVMAGDVSLRPKEA